MVIRLLQPHDADIGEVLCHATGQVYTEAPYVAEVVGRMMLGARERWIKRDLQKCCAIGGKHPGQLGKRPLVGWDLLDHMLDYHQVHRVLGKRREVAEVGLVVDEAHGAGIVGVAAPGLIDALVSPSALAQEVAEDPWAHRSRLQRAAAGAVLKQLGHLTRERAMTLQCVADLATSASASGKLDEAVGMANRAGLEDHARG